VKGSQRVLILSKARGLRLGYERGCEAAGTRLEGRKWRSETSNLRPYHVEKIDRITIFDSCLHYITLAN